MSHKKIFVLGATGGTGRQILKQALEGQHEITVFARNPRKMLVQHDRLRVVAGDVTSDKTLLAEAMKGQDAVISALGRGMSLRSADLIQRSIQPILRGMQSQGVRRLIFTSALGVGESFQEAPLLSKIFIRLMLRDIYRDKEAGEELLRRSDLDWTLVYPAQLTNGPKTGNYRVGEHLNLRGFARISRADVAHFILAQLEDTTYLRKAALLSY